MLCTHLRETGSLPIHVGSIDKFHARVLLETVNYEQLEKRAPGPWRGMVRPRVGIINDTRLKRAYVKHFSQCLRAGRSIVEEPILRVLTTQDG